jgi:hypothetical protein
MNKTILILALSLAPQVSFAAWTSDWDEREAIRTATETLKSTGTAFYCLKMTGGANANYSNQVNKALDKMKSETGFKELKSTMQIMDPTSSDPSVCLNINKVL